MRAIKMTIQMITITKILQIKMIHHRVILEVQRLTQIIVAQKKIMKKAITKNLRTLRKKTITKNLRTLIKDPLKVIQMIALPTKINQILLKMTQTMTVMKTLQMALEMIQAIVDLPLQIKIQVPVVLLLQMRTNLVKDQVVQNN